MDDSSERNAAAPPGEDFHKVVLDAIPDPIFVVDDDVRILDCNASAARMLGGALVFGSRGGEVLHCLHAEPAGCGRAPACQQCVIRNAVARAYAGAPLERARHQLSRREHTGEVDLLVTAAPIRYRGAALVLIILEDITELVALRQIVPICAHCHKVRDDAAYWQNVELYCRRRLGIQFSHGICPECLARHYPEWTDAPAGA